eukprot:CAMPEP_0181256770 /NCGR_PEP_ID=MMETSP1096-20121128/49888_1 /TAXON_ID=156174 ORGANISM="Chrysochromulina ericina, Strain CCMP281" /NCGR_SAMPLE_ID=MMETSP1096 /ASSEMBLY_ACC=CAM_ASM_000453 /LENGTH=98 /DNA_ID=CAMNT_0023355043 /DNA_START=424 /DNA_END=721 /DNA_ORIENTATION=+
MHVASFVQPSQDPRPTRSQPAAAASSKVRIDGILPGRRRTNGADMATAVRGLSAVQCATSSVEREAARGRKAARTSSVTAVEQPRRRRVRSLDQGMAC